MKVEKINEKFMNEKFSYLLKNVFIFTIGNLGSKIILFFMVPLYTNYLSKEEYGIAEYVFTISQLLVPIVSLSIWEGIVRMGLKKETKAEDILYNSFIVFSGSIFLVILITPLWKLYLSLSPWRLYLATYILVYILNQIELNYIKIKEKNKLFALSSIIQTLLLALLNILLLVRFKCGVKGYLLSNIIAILLTDFIIFFADNFPHDLKQGHVNLPLLKEMFVYSAPLVINNISWWIIHSSDKIMIEFMLSPGELGLYTVASKIPSLINVFVSVFTQAWGISSIREMESSNDKNYYSKVFEIYSILLFSCMLFFTAIVKPFMSIYVGNDFFESWKLVPLLFYAAVFQAFSSYFGSLFGALQESVKTMTTTIIGGIVNIVLNYIFISVIGIWGAIIGTVSAFLIIVAIRAILLNVELHLNISWKKFFINASMCLLCTILVSLSNYTVNVVIFIISIFIFINYRQINNIINMGKNIIVKLKK